jgi:hypothetical protein
VMEPPLMRTCHCSNCSRKPSGTSWQGRQAGPQALLLLLLLVRAPPKPQWRLSSRKQSG